MVDGQDANYLQVVSSYIHLNPARAGLIRLGGEALAPGNVTSDDLKDGLTK